MGKSIFDPLPILVLSMMFSFILRSQLFIWQAHNALFMIRCLLKVFIREMSEEELHLQFSYQERAAGSCGGELLGNRSNIGSEAVSMLFNYIDKLLYSFMHIFYFIFFNYFFCSNKFNIYFFK